MKVYDRKNKNNLLYDTDDILRKLQDRVGSIDTLSMTVGGAGDLRVHYETSGETILVLPAEAEALATGYMMPQLQQRLMGALPGTEDEPAAT